MEQKHGKGSFWGLVPLLTFLVLYIITGVSTQNFNSMPLMIGILIASAVALMMHRKGEVDRTTFAERVTKYCVGGGDDGLILMVIVFLLAGGFYGVSKGMHAVDAVTNLGLDILPVKLILPGLFVIGCIISFAMGTSMGTVAALMPIGVSLALKIHGNMALFCGTVVGSAMFGDNLSMISASVIAATRTQDVSMMKKFKTNIAMLLPAIIVNLVLLAMQPVGQGVHLSGNHPYDLLNLLPYILVIVLSFTGMHVILVLTLGILAGVAIGVFHGDFSLVKSMTVIHNGMMSMEDMALIAILVGGLVALMDYLGGIDWIINALTRKIKSAKGGEFAIAGLVSLLDIITTNNTVSIITAGPLAKDIGDQFGISAPRIASDLVTFSCAFNGLIPYGGQLLVAAGLAKISPMQIVPYSWYCLLMLVSSIGFILLSRDRN
ncbi:Na+/H+ antiporter NhaC family protein [Ligilactobacillus sp. 110_WCHN]|uniref:Na+/H+ antiporter NhaC family protein n=1 Tax=Ligilactobacillus sp. 110_WCHN TaxID=3057125 RepID=UPI0026725DE6|nr:Na+/H+ antiporter NhaC family protein [Ligilactobacillus sp. 110_WCHN]MDO3392781.1 Na+/H+ antiporter NhaC family protein [Ligilactobacillus sp. 110_WCHN]